MKYLIKNSKIVLEDQVKTCDLLLENGLIAEIGASLNHDNHTQVIDGSDYFALPGLIDIHTHLDDSIGPYYLADTYSSGSQIAIKNGICALMSFITESNQQALNQAIEQAHLKADQHSLCSYHWHLTPTRFDNESLKNIEHLIQHGFKSFKLYTTYKEAGIFSDYNQIKAFAHFLKSNNAKLLIHCEDEYILQQSKNAQHDSAYKHCLQRPKNAEYEAVMKILDICATTQTSCHIVHVSDANTAKEIIKAKQRLPITFETCPQYLFLNDTYLKENTGYQYLCSPPLRDIDSVSELKALAVEGLIDIFATDHCAFYRIDKDKYKEQTDLVPKGIAGIGALSPLIYQLFKSHFENDSNSIFQKMAQHLSANPAKLCDIYPQKGVIRTGSDADIVLVKETEAHEVIPSISDTYNPYKHLKSNFQVDYVFRTGELIVEKEKINLTYAQRLNRKGNYEKMQ